MRNILLVEPDYRSKFPPLGLLKLSTYHKSRGDAVTFVRGRIPEMKELEWDRIYIASLFTWELPRTLKTIKYYRRSVRTAEDILVGGVAATLYPQWLEERTDAKIIVGPMNRVNMLEKGSPDFTKLIPDYSVLDTVDYDYYPSDAYFARITTGCIRTCKFCAVPLLEPDFGFLKGIKRQIAEVDKSFGERQHLVVMDNNILGIDNIQNVLGEIAAIGFEAGAKLNGRRRTVDFNQGIDARLIKNDPSLAKHLSKIALSPVRLAFDFIGMKDSYTRAIEHMASNGFAEFTNYMLFNYKDTPEDLYNRFLINSSLNRRLGVRITGFPMRFIPMDDVHRNHVAEAWEWRYLRGIQCVLLATRGLVSPNPDFVAGAFGETYEEFLEILSMPDRYIIYRNEYCQEAKAWRSQWRRYSESSKNELLRLLSDLNKNYRGRKERIHALKKFRSIIEHYYPDGNTPPRTPSEERMAQQGVSAGYDSGPG